MTIGENIRRIRKEKGLTQKQLGERCGINEANIRKYELNNANPKTETLKKISNALGCNIIDLDNSLFQKSDNILHKQYNIGEIVAKRREELDLSLNDLSELTDYDIAILKALENGEDYFSSKILEDIAKKLGLSVLDMLGSESGYYHICQDKDGCTRIDTISIGDDPIFVPESLHERMLADRLNEFQENTDYNKRDFPTWTALLTAICDILHNPDIYTELTDIPPYLYMLNSNGFHKVVEYIHDLVEIQYYTMLNDCQDSEKEHYIQLQNHIHDLQKKYNSSKYQKDSPKS